MSDLTDRAAYLRGMADGMGVTKDTNEHKLLLEILDVMGEMAEKISELDEDVGELNDYVDSIDEDLTEMEDLFMGDEDDYDDDDDEDDDDDIDEDDDEEIAFDCKHCGKTVSVKPSDIDVEESPVCPNCGKPFFPG